MSDINPRIVDGKPVFSGDASRPFWNAIRRVKGLKTHAVLYSYGCKAQEMESENTKLRRQRDEARRELCEIGASYNCKIDGCFVTPLEYAMDREWGYLYADARACAKGGEG